MNNSPTVLEIHSKAIKHNLLYFQSKLQSKTRTLVVIKAFSYGSDAIEIAKILEGQHVDYLAVSYASEGIELRNAGIILPILILHAQIENFDKIIEYNLEPAIYSQRSLKLFIERCEHVNEPYAIHIKINSGMNRLGFKMEDRAGLMSILIPAKERVKVKSTFSHLASSEDKTSKEFTMSQIIYFNDFAEKISIDLGYKPMKHICNSSGILQYPEAHFDMVRIGIGLYGFANIPEETKRLKNTHFLKTKISQIQHLDKGESVGYNQSYRVERPSRIATLSLGYADGLKRVWSNSGISVSVNQYLAPIVGKICMCITMIDVTDIDCKEGDEVIIFKTQDQILELASKAQTIPYEILTSISQRVRRELK
ncbi:alanine racemase [Namhaeicola litoreus]|uniref:Alanine racemase n=1 Tax=Namhaeicola litoreus TaxID=1052145 RepID=A0ABW3Y0H4_9FLAO